MIIKRDEIFKSVCNFITPDDKEGNIIGAGLLISRNNIPYLLSATHVLFKRVITQ